ncbi:MAG: HupE/UreJ family protein [Betaproteobacteria bacterium]|nr:HupE/UreJ family protein [Betaproteobacteria bacterium]
MSLLPKRLLRIARGSTCCGCLFIAFHALFPGSASAHLVLSQRGTLNIVDDKAVLVLSVPVAAFRGADDDGDGRLSRVELAAHWAGLEKQATGQIELRDSGGPLPLRSLDISPTAPDDAPAAPVAQIVVLAELSLRTANSPLIFHANLFGASDEERTLAITVNRGIDTQLVLLTPERPSRILFPPASAVFADYLQEGVNHILRGFDHLLFLLVVLAAGWGWRQVLIALTCFTIGHSITLVISTWGDLTVPSALVEPAIAATIVAMAAFDWQVRRKKLAPSSRLRYALVFGCSLIHGLGLASSFGELGLDGTHRLPSLAGFNIGIELGQIAFASVALLLMATLRRWRGRAALEETLHYASVTAMAVGFVWFVQRVL